MSPVYPRPAVQLPTCSTSKLEGSRSLSLPCHEIILCCRFEQVRRERHRTASLPSHGSATYGFITGRMDRGMDGWMVLPAEIANQAKEGILMTGSRSQRPGTIAGVATPPPQVNWNRNGHMVGLGSSTTTHELHCPARDVTSAAKHDPGVTAII